MYISILRNGPLNIVFVVQAVDSNDQKTCDGWLTIVSHILKQQERANSIDAH